MSEVEDVARIIAEAAVAEINSKGNVCLKLPDVCRCRITGAVQAGDLIVTLHIPLHQPEETPRPPAPPRRPPRRAG